MKNIIAIPLFLVYLLWAGMCPASDTPDFVIMTYDSFAVSEGLFDAFEARHHVNVKILKSGDTGAALNQAILSKKNPLGDLFFGVHSTLMSRALRAGIFSTYESPRLDQVPDQLKLDPENRLLPVDFGDICLNYDRQWFARNNIAPPTGLDDLLDPRCKGLTVVQNPATSSPGLAFLLATVGRYGEKGYLDFWKQLRANDLYVSMGWSDAYYGQFTRAKGGTRPIVVSYASSPAAEVFYSEDKPDQSPTAAVFGSRTAYRQIEFVGILKGTKMPDVARMMVDFMLGPEFQKDIPQHMWVFPAVTGTPLPDVFARHARQAEEPVILSPEVIADNRDGWIDAWTEAVLR